VIPFARPATLEVALELLATDRWRPLAGGTDVYPTHAERPIEQPLLDISGLCDLRGVVETETGWRIGALTTWADILKANLPPAFVGLKLAAREVGSAQIQNVGTIAGNLCNASPAADGMPPLLTLDASVELRSRRGARLLPLGDFVLGNRTTARLNDELLTALLIPRTSAAGAGDFLKLGARKHLVISIAMVAVRLTAEGGRVTEARVAVGACSAVALRLASLERALEGAPLKGLSKRVVKEHVEALSPIDDVRASAAYRLDAACSLARRALDRAALRLQ
jgi:CO/xanthine dehydrogenase FAD-binding subunit